MKRWILSAAWLWAAGNWAGCDYQPYRQGEQLYLKQCAHCHMEDGSGLERVIPALAGNELLLESGAEVACLIRRGAQDSFLLKDRWIYGDMPPNEKLNATEISNLLNYLRNAWGNSASPLSVQAIEEALSKCE